jgi:flagellar hook assembly protein FlgD
VTSTNTYTITVTPTNTKTVTPTVTPSNTFTVTNTNTPTVTPTITVTWTPTISPTWTQTPPLTYTVTNTPTVTNTVTVTNTYTATNTSTTTVTPTNTNTLTPTKTPTATFTSTLSVTPTNTFTQTNTFTLTVTPTVTVTLTPTISPTWTQTPPLTYTITETPTQTLTPTMTNTPTQTNTLTQTNTPSVTVTLTPTISPTWTQTPPLTYTQTETPTQTITPTQSDTLTQTNTLTVTNTHTQTNTPTTTLTFTPSATPTPTATWTATGTFTNTPPATNTWTYTATASFTSTPSSTPTPTDTPTPTSTPTDTLTSTFTKTSTLTPTATSTTTFSATPTFTPLGLVTISKQVSASTAGAGSALLYTLTLNVANSNAQNLVVTDLLPTNLTFQSFGTSPSGVTPAYNQATSVMNWSMPSPLAPGQYQMTYQAMVNNLVAAGMNIQNCALATFLGGTANACVTTQTIGQYTVKVGVYNEAGELVESLPVNQYSQAINSFNLSSGSITQVSGPGSATTILFAGVPIGTWSGTDSLGNPVGNGEYYVKVDSTSNMGVDTSVIQPVIVNRSVFKVSLKIYNEAGEAVKTLYLYTSNPVAGTANQLQLSASSIEPTSGPVTGSIPAQLTIGINNGTTIVWDGTQDNGGVVPSGQYFIEASEQNGTGGETIMTAHVMVVSDTANAGMGNILAEPNLLNGVTGYQVTFSSAVPGLTLDYRVYDAAGELVIGKMPGDGAGSSSAHWDATGKASGLYFAVVDAINAQGGQIGYKILKIVVVR